MKYFAALALLGITALFLANDFFTAGKNKLAAMVNLHPLTEPQIIQQGKRSVLMAQVYSTFPFNHKHLLAINAGAEQGVVVGMPVTTEGNLLLGQIVEVSNQQALVQTIFDNDWTLPVRVGPTLRDALLVGGQNPRLTLIDKNDVVQKGDIVISARKEFPYGMSVGEVGEVNNLVAHSFQEAELVFPYTMRDLREVAVILK
ncbi:MAG: Uncharacterized protein G01um101419_350 [Parcubacteria group bacterium Gr01-1014_19]|nr:MAG: Uncharacterized protein G01um101419_350 [Parcubacteria group bacterium Gr01-1014_19]